MIYDQWYAILESGELKAGRKAGVRRLGEYLVVWRDDNGAPACVADRCVHRGAALSCGRVVDGKIQCPFHGFRYDPSGRCVLIPANGAAEPVPENFRTRSYAAREAYGFIWIFWGDKKEDLPPIKFFDDIDDSFSYSGVSSHWPVHYTRCVENQLDVVHLPFVHATTIGAGAKTVVNGPYVVAGGGEIKFWVQNETEKGQKPLKPEEMAQPGEGRFHIHFIFPNLWQNWIGPKMRIFISFTPVDESNTVIYMRVYQKMITFPVISRLFNFVMMLYSRIILGQDRRVVITQKPVKSELAMGENLVQGDLPIAKYRMMRDELKRK